MEWGKVNIDFEKQSSVF